MYKSQLFNSEIIQVLSKMGHTDQIAIGDVGLPIASDIQRIDLAVTYGIPSFIQVFQAVSQEMQIEKVILAEEIIKKNCEMHKIILEQIRNLEKTQNKSIEIIYVSHEKLKLQTHYCKAVIRTGECSPFSNIILQSGVIF